VPVPQNISISEIILKFKAKAETVLSRFVPFAERHGYMSEFLMSEFLRMTSSHS